VDLEGDRPLPEDELRGALRSEDGRRVTEWELQDDAERLRERLVRAGFLEAQVGARLEESRAVFAVRGGPRYTWEVEGMSDPPSLDSTIREAFHEEEALELGSERLLRALRDRGHLRAEVNAQALPAEGQRRLVFEAVPGPRLEV
jgi:outer membrane protein assembly factor BamA